MMRFSAISITFLLLIGIQVEAYGNQAQVNSRMEKRHSSANLFPYFFMKCLTSECKFDRGFVERSLAFKRRQQQERNKLKNDLPKNKLWSTHGDETVSKSGYNSNMSSSELRNKMASILGDETIIKTGYNNNMASTELRIKTNNNNERTESLSQNNVLPFFGIIPFGLSTNQNSQGRNFLKINQNSKHHDLLNIRRNAQSQNSVNQTTEQTSKDRRRQLALDVFRNPIPRTLTQRLFRNRLIDRMFLRYNRMLSDFMKTRRISQFRNNINLKSSRNSLINSRNTSSIQVKKHYRGQEHIKNVNDMEANIKHISTKQLPRIRNINFDLNRLNLNLQKNISTSNRIRPIALQEPKLKFRQTLIESINKQSTQKRNTSSHTSLVSDNLKPFEPITSSLAEIARIKETHSKNMAEANIFLKSNPKADNKKVMNIMSNGTPMSLVCSSHKDQLYICTPNQIELHKVDQMPNNKQSVPIYRPKVNLQTYIDPSSLNNTTNFAVPNTKDSASSLHLVYVNQILPEISKNIPDRRQSGNVASAISEATNQDHALSGARLPPQMLTIPTKQFTASVSSNLMNSATHVGTNSKNESSNFKKDIQNILNSYIPPF